MAQGGPSFIAVGPTDLYWGNETNNFNKNTGTIGRVPLDGGASIVMGSSLRTTGIAIDSTSLYWTNGASVGGGDAAVLKMPLGGGPVTTLASGLASAIGIALDASNAYFLAYDGINKVALDGGPVTPVVSASFYNSPVGLAIDTTNLYWIQGCDGGNCVARLPLGGGPPVTIFSATMLDYFSGLAAANGNAYFSLSECDGGGCGANLLRSPSSGGAAATLGSGFSFVSQVAADGAHVYWGGSLCPPAGSGCTNSVWRVPVDGGANIALATGQPTVAFALDASSVYWSEGNGKVARLTPK